MKKNRLVLCFLLTILLLVFNINAYGAGFDLPEPSRYFYVYDEANIIDEYLEAYIINTNEQLYSKTGAQIVVATLNSLDGRSEQEIAVQLFREWGIGSQDKNNGILMLIAPNEKRLWIEVGYGLEGPLPDGRVGEIRDKQIFPYFKENDFNTGILKGFDTLLSVVAQEYNIESFDNSDYRNYDEYNDDESANGRLSGIKPILIVIGIIIFLFIDFRFFGGMLTMLLIRSSSRGGFGGGRGGRGGGNRGGGGSSGGGGAGGGW